MAKALPGSKDSTIQRLKSSLSNMREAAQVAARRFSIVAVAAAVAYGTGRLMGWAKFGPKNADGTPQRQVYVPNTVVPIPLAAGLVAALAGIVGSKLMGEQVSDVVLGLGAGAIDGSLSVMGYEAAQLAAATP